MKRSIFAVFFLLCLVSQPVKAFSLEATNNAIARYIENRAPVVVADSFLSSIGKLYCFSLINGAEKETSITHLWLFEGREMARVELPVRSSSWRTWSSKTLQPEWTGAWEVKILDENENLLGSVLFRLE
jgi:hypothetical protein